MGDLGGMIKAIVGLGILTLIGGAIFISIQYWWVVVLLAMAAFGTVAYRRQRAREKNMV